jgi:HSP20 family molecular chaperone IbpA
MERPARKAQRIYFQEGDMPERETIARARRDERDDVSVEVTDDNVLTVSGERSYGRFFRSVPLPEGTDAGRVEASFKNGVLEVTMPAPKREERGGRRITVRS